MNTKNDIIIIGGGIVGIATAYNILLRKSNLRVTIIEKEAMIASHQTGNNSGVIHSGIYYKPNSLKAINCISGYNKLLAFCDQENIPYDICGKIIVQSTPKEKELLNGLYERGKHHGLNGIKLLSQGEINEIEPHVTSLGGILVPQTGIVDYKIVCQKYLEKFISIGGEIKLNTKVTGITSQHNQNIVITTQGDFESKIIINCAGLYSDKVTKMTNASETSIIIPFRGEYYKLKDEKKYLVKNLIYPVPNPNFPFLGVHFTRMMDGVIEVGPNAVLAFSKEGYNRWKINPKELYEVLTFPGFRKLASKYWDEGLMEMKRSFSKKLFVKAIQVLIPEIQEQDVYRGGAGVRAQSCGIDGSLIDDFQIVKNNNIINVCNAPSPAATSSLSIGESISGMALSLLNSKTKI